VKYRIQVYLTKGKYIWFEGKKKKKVAEWG